jgi:hypothetical protein
VRVKKRKPAAFWPTGFDTTRQLPEQKDKVRGLFLRVSSSCLRRATTSQRSNRRRCIPARHGPCKTHARIKENEKKWQRQRKDVSLPDCNQQCAHGSDPHSDANRSEKVIIRPSVNSLSVEIRTYIHTYE